MTKEEILKRADWGPEEDATPVEAFCDGFQQGQQDAIRKLKIKGFYISDSDGDHPTTDELLEIVRGEKS